MQPFEDGISQMDLQDFRNPASPVRCKTTAHQDLPPSTHGWAEKALIYSARSDTTSNWPVECDGAEAEHGGRAEEFVQELEGLAEDGGVKPPAAAGAGAQRDVEGHAHQAGADPRARHVLHEAVGHGLEDVGAAGAPQHRGISCGEYAHVSLENTVFTVCWLLIDYFSDWLFLSPDTVVFHCMSTKTNRVPALVQQASSVVNSEPPRS